jgi:serine/threonine protein kinase
MSPGHWERIRELFGEAEKRRPEDREAFLNEACSDRETYEAVIALLAATAKVEFQRGAEPISARTTWPELTEGTLLKQRYRVQQEIGQGGFSRVFLATDEHLHNRRVVVKVLQNPDISDEWSEARFDDEIRTLSMIDDPGVIGVLDAGKTDDDLRYLVMQYAEGRTLRKLLAKSGMPFARVAKLITQVAHAVGAAHKLGIIHQDIKPENIMVQELPDGRDRVRLIE